jgi:hypothetical protein
MNVNERSASPVAAAIELLRAALAGARSPVGSHLDREERDARAVVRVLRVVVALRQNTALP